MIITILATPQDTPKRVEGLGGARVAAVAIGGYHTLAADEEGVVWDLGELSGELSAHLVDSNDSNADHIPAPTPIPTLRVRALKSS